MSEECVRRVDGQFFLNDSGLSVQSRDLTVLTQEFLDWFLFASQGTIYALGTGAAQKNLSVPKFRGLGVPVPPLNEQKRIVARLNEVSGVSAEALQLAGSRLEAASSLRQSILESAFRGEL